ncbi:DUF721 domain-containing protein [Pontivivens insulae]|uniref:RNA-binding protein n=1 Tax=Pontivivens insulae TaxID=1639689 RepID=A0A2R8A8N4_9RHOB|nr:DciA family protein [Pontivivens insulae]RED18607.1 hypothetical protein DFR53_0805 [Pontivivens insulae]SPF28505.1 hypothetical protein POI8812_00806 [Pontivivens insulae]
MRKQAKGTQWQPKRARRFTKAGSLIAPQLKRASETRGFAQIRLLTDWEEIVGPDIAALARPQKVSYAKKGFGATLVLLVQGAAAPQVQMMVPQIMERVNACYGYSAISRVTLTQTAATGFAEGQVPFAHKPQAAPALSPEIEAQMRSDLREVGDEGLRAALLSLGKNIETRTK